MSVLNVSRVALALLALASPVAGQNASPQPCPAPEARQFDFWIGEWDVLNRQSPPGNPAWFTTGRATDRVYATVGGCAVVEHWRGTAFQGLVLGFSIRAWNPGSQEWDLVLLWPSPGQPRFGELHGAFRHGRGDFLRAVTTPEGDTTLIRFSFADVTPRSLRWQDGRSADRGSSWASSWIMEFARRDEGATGLWNGPTQTTERCPADEHRAFDDQLGEWTGKRRGPSGTVTDVRVHTIGILEGCATLQRAWAVDGSWESLAVRAYEPVEGRWLQYSISTDHPVLRRWEAPGSERPTAWSSGEGSRITLHAPERGWRWVEETRDDPGGAWKPVTEVRVTARVGS